MHLQVRCFTCGVVLGHVAKIYREELMRKINAIRGDKNIAVTKILTDPTIEIDITELIDQLQIESDCCKKDLISAMNLQDYM
jgi:DNA-directed RNA polymerase subunit N (RpoN/RPB10)